jgi:hypothetical protein
LARRILEAYVTYTIGVLSISTIAELAARSLPDEGRLAFDAFAALIVLMKLAPSLEASPGSEA